MPDAVHAQRWRCACPGWARRGFRGGHTLVQIELAGAIAVSRREHLLDVHEELVQLDELREGELSGLVGIVHADHGRD